MDTFTTDAAAYRPKSSEETAPDQRENSGEPAKKQRGRPFQKGQSGNPAGRPKGLGPVGVRALARRHTALALAALSEIAAHSTSISAHVTAANALLDRGWGKF